MSNIILSKIEHKPSIALQAMVDGLKNTLEQPNSEIKMNTYGTAEGEICFKCAATSAIENLFNHVFALNEIHNISSRSRAIKLDWVDLQVFEYTMDDARRGNLSRLFHFCNIDYTNRLWNLFDGYFCLNNEDWKEQLPIVEEVIERLKTLGY